MGHREWHTWIGVAALLAVLCGLASGDPPAWTVSRRMAHRAHHGDASTSQGDASLSR
jgi:hypothetical protein